VALGKNRSVNVPAANRFASVFETMAKAGRLSEDDRDMLICHYNASEHKLTGREMSALMGWGGQTANRFYGNLARRIAEESDWVPTEHEGYDGFHVSVLILGSRSQGSFEWTMRPQVARALEMLKWPELTRLGGSEPAQGPLSITEYRGNKG
jgi:hypothetical protein